MENLEIIRDRVIKHHELTENDVNEIANILKDSIGMDMRRGNLLFEIKEHALKGKYDPRFKKVFVDAITKFLLDDDNSPGKIDPEEAKWLRARIQYNGEYDAFDKAVIDNIRKKSINFPKILQQKSRQARIFENLLYSSRYLSILAVVGSLISSVALFLRGGMVVYESIHGFFTDMAEGKVHPSYEKMFEELVSSVDIFLFALVLIIFGVGVYELFINKIDPVERENDTRPSWLRISSVDDLKSSLGKVILMVLIVSFFKHTLELSKSDWGPTTLLYLAIGILLISAALYLTHKSGGHETGTEEGGDESAKHE